MAEQVALSWRGVAMSAPAWARGAGVEAGARTGGAPRYSSRIDRPASAACLPAYPVPTTGTTTAGERPDGTGTREDLVRDND